MSDETLKPISIASTWGAGYPAVRPYAVDVPEYYCDECGEAISEADAQDEDKTHMIGDRYYHAECCPECKRHEAEDQE